MSLHADLLEQAFALALLERGKPKQASLRRALSSAYYAFFHLLVSEGAALIGSKLGKEARIRLRRAFVHADMKAVCASYASTQSRFPPQIASLLTFPLDADLQALAALFLELQERRHLADYDIASVFNRTDVLAQISALNVMFDKWARLRASANAKIFLADLLLRKSWSRQ
ncbi:MAG TPA: hypothetical protein VF800_01980 [Telluria sp.]